MRACSVKLILPALVMRRVKARSDIRSMATRASCVLTDADKML